MKHDDRHGGAYDRGSADSWYRRPRKPHYYKGGTGTSELVSERDMNPEEVKAYNAGFDDNEANGEFKDYGQE